MNRYEWGVGMIKETGKGVVESEARRGRKRGAKIYLLERMCRK